MPPRPHAKTDSIEGVLVEYTPPRKRAKLDTLLEVRREMAKVYREARSGIIDNQDASRQVWMLQAIGRVIVESDIEVRLDRLEKLTNDPDN